LDQLEQRLDVDARRRHQQIGQLLAVQFGGFDVGTGYFEDFADQRVAVGVWAGRGQGDQRVTGGDFRTVDDFALFYHADAETGQVVVFAFIHAGHLGSLAAHQGTAGQFAAGADAGDHGGG